MAKSRGDFRRWSEMVGEVPRCAATNHSTRISRLIDLIIATSFSSILRRLPLVVLCSATFTSTLCAASPFMHLSGFDELHAVYTVLVGYTLQLLKSDICGVDHIAQRQ